MSPVADRFAIVIALILSAAAAIGSAQGRSGEAFQKLGALLLTSATAESSVTAGAIGEGPEVSEAP